MAGRRDARGVTVAVRALMLGVDHLRRSLAERYDVSVPGLITLAELRQWGPLTPKSIGDLLGWSTGGVTSLLDRLEHAGHVKRTPNPADRRSVLIEPTAQGNRIMEQAFTRLDIAIADAMDTSKVDREQLIAFLETTAANLAEAVDE